MSAIPIPHEQVVTAAAYLASTGVDVNTVTGRGTLKDFLKGANSVALPDGQIVELGQVDFEPYKPVKHDADKLKSSNMTAWEDDSHAVRNNKTGQRFSGYVQTGSGLTKAEHAAMRRPDLCKSDSIGYDKDFIGQFGDGIGGFVAAGVHAWGNDKSAMYDRKKSATTFASGLNGPDGGFVMPTDYAAGIQTHLGIGGVSLLPYANKLRVAGNGAFVAHSDLAPWQTGALLPQWTEQGASASEQKPTFRRAEIRAFKLRLFIPYAIEMLEDTQSFTDYLMSTVGESFTYAVNDAMLVGDGVAKPLGVFAAQNNARVTVARQTALSVTAKDTIGLQGRMPKTDNSRQTYVMNHDCYPSIGTATIGQNGYMILPQVGANGQVMDTIGFRPLIKAQSMATLGTEGDFGLVDWSAYQAVIKSIGETYRVDMYNSRDYLLQQDLMALSLTLRLGGMPIFTAAIAPKNGSSNLSPYATLTNAA